MMKKILLCTGALVCCGVISLASANPQPLAVAETDQIFGAGSNCGQPSLVDGCVEPCYVQKKIEFDGHGDHKLHKEYDCEYTVYPPGGDPENRNCGGYTSSLPCN